MLLALPLLTRVYTPADFDLFAVFSAAVNILAIVSCLRFDVAIPLPKSNHIAVNLLAAALVSCAIINIVVMLLVFFFPELIGGALGIGSAVWLVPLCACLTGFYSAFQYWAVRDKKYKDVSISKLSQSVGTVGTQGGFSSFGLGGVGLAVGQCVGAGLGWLALFRSFLSESKFLIKRVKFRRALKCVKRYERYPKVSTFEALANTAGIQLPLIIIAVFTVSPEAGFLALSMRVLQAPMGLIGQSVSQVFLSNAPEEYRRGDIGTFSKKILLGLAKVGVGPIVFLGVLAPSIFPTIFGESWSRSGYIVAILTPWFVFQFLASPISMIMHVRDRQGMMLLLTIVGFFLRCGGVFWTVFYWPDFAVEAFAVTSAAFYAICLVVFSRYCELKVGSLIGVLGVSVVVAALWGGGGFLLSIFLGFLCFSEY